MGDIELQPYHVLPCPIEKAESFYEGAATYTAIKLREPFFFIDIDNIEATFDLPEERTITNIALRVDIICSAIADSDGKVAQILKPLSEAFNYQKDT